MVGETWLLVALTPFAVTPLREARILRHPPPIVRDKAMARHDMPGAGHPARPKRNLDEGKASRGAKLARMSEQWLAFVTVSCVVFCMCTCVTF